MNPLNILAWEYKKRVQLAMIILFFSLGWYTYYLFGSGCSKQVCITYLNGETVCGDKSELRAMGCLAFEKIAQEGYTVVPMPEEPPLLCEACPPCQPPPCNCPTCPEPKACPTIDHTKITNQKPKVENPTYQKGWYDMRKICLTAIGQPTAKFNEAPSNPYTIANIK